MRGIDWLIIASSGGCCDKENVVSTVFIYALTVPFAATETEHDDNLREGRLWYLSTKPSLKLHNSLRIILFLS